MVFFQWLFLSLGVVFASSFDGFMVGISYSARGLSMNSMHYLIMALCTGTMMGLSMCFGKLLTAWLPNMVENYLGAAILICLGLWQIWQGTQTGQTEPRPEKEAVVAIEEQKRARRVFQLLNTIMDIVEEPLRADWDRSGTIDRKEAWLLGIALGLDALAAGLGTSVAGFSMVVIPVAAVASPAFVYAGAMAGRFSILGRKIGETRFLPGAILIVIGAARIFC